MSPDGKKFMVEPMSPGLDDVSENKEVSTVQTEQTDPPEQPEPAAPEQPEQPEPTAPEITAPRGSKRLAAEQAAGRATLIRKFGYEETGPADPQDQAATKGKRKRK